MNDGPVQTSSPFTFTSIDEDNSKVITKAQLLEGYTDEEGNPMFVNGLSASNGTLQQSGDSWTFTPIEHFVGTVDLIYVINDSNGGGQLATNSFEVVEVNDAPVRTQGSINTLTLLEDGPISSMNIPSNLTYSTGGASTAESAQNLTYTISALPIDPNGDPAGTVYKYDASTVVNAGSFVSNDYYTIISVGDTDWTALGSPSNTVGTSFKATAAGSGSGTASLNAIVSNNTTLSLEELRNLNLYLLPIRLAPSI